MKTILRIDNTSGFIGVSYKKELAKPWQATIKKDNKTLFLGYFKEAMEAALARDKAARNLHGPRAKLNFPLVLGLTQKNDMDTKIFVDNSKLPMVL
jgi:hypothetical protein